MLLRTIMGGGTSRRDQFAQEGVPPLSSMPWATGSGTIDVDEALKIAAIRACVSLLSDTVATLPVGTFERQNGTRIPVARPDWLDHPIPLDPTFTRIDHFTQVMWSLVLDTNAYTLVLPDVYDPAELRVVNPQRVTMRRQGEWILRMDGGGNETVGPDQMIHVKRDLAGGSYQGTTPMTAGTTFAMKRAADRFGERVFNQGIFLSGQMLLPGPASDDVITQLTDQITQQYVGTANAGKPGIFANGAKWDVPQLNLQQMQLIELHQWAKLEAAGLFRVPPYLIGVQEHGMAHASVEAQGIDFEKYTIRPYVERIEAQYQRLIPGLKTFLKFNTDGLLRADFKTRWEGYQIGLQSKVYYIEDIWRLEDLDPGRTGHLLETPNNNPPAAPSDVPARRAEEEAERERRHAETIAVLAQQPAPHVEVHGAPVTVQPAAAPIVTIADGAIRAEIHPTEVHVTTPPVEVNVPAAVVEVRAEPIVHVDPTPVNVAAPTVQVTMPDELHVRSMPDRITHRVVKRDASGAITDTSEVETDG